MLDDLSKGTRERVRCGRRSSTSRTSAIRTRSSTPCGRRPSSISRPRRTCAFGRAARRRRRRERARHGPDPRGGAPARCEGRLLVDGRRRSTANAQALRPSRRRGSRLRPTARRSSAARSTSRRGTACTAHSTSPYASATSTGRARSRTAKPASSRSSWACCTKAARRRSSATEARRATTCSSSDVVRAMLPRSSSQGGVFNVGTGVETSVLELYEAIQRASGVDAGGGAAPRRGSASCSAASSTSRSPSASSAGGRDALARRGLARTWALDRAGVARAGRESVRAVQHAEPIPTSFPWRSATLVVGAIAAVELLVLDRRRRARTSYRSTRPHGRLLLRRRSMLGPFAHPTAVAALPSHPLRARSSVHVLVLNGNGVQGAASTEAARLQRAGYRIAARRTRCAKTTPGRWCSMCPAG